MYLSLNISVVFLYSLDERWSWWWPRPLWDQNCLHCRTNFAHRNTCFSEEEEKYLKSWRTCCTLQYSENSWVFVNNISSFFFEELLVLFIAGRNVKSSEGKISSSKQKKTCEPHGCCYVGEWKTIQKSETHEHGLRLLSIFSRIHTFLKSRIFWGKIVQLTA